LTRKGFEDAARSDWTPIDTIGHLVADLATGRADRLSGRFIHVHDDLNELIAHASEIERDDLHQLRMHTYVSRPWEPPQLPPEEPPKEPAVEPAKDAPPQPGVSKKRRPRRL